MTRGAEALRMEGESKRRIETLPRASACDRRSPDPAASPARRPQSSCLQDPATISPRESPVSCGYRFRRWITNERLFLLRHRRQRHAAAGADPARQGLSRSKAPTARSTRGGRRRNSSSCARAASSSMPRTAAASRSADQIVVDLGRGRGDRARRVGGAAASARA